MALAAAGNSENRLIWRYGARPEGEGEKQLKSSTAKDSERRKLMKTCAKEKNSAQKRKREKSAQNQRRYRNNSRHQNKRMQTSEKAQRRILARHLSARE
jgi:hypothetical protein